MVLVGCDLLSRDNHSSLSEVNYTVYIYQPSDSDRNFVRNISIQNCSLILLAVPKQQNIICPTIYPCLQREEKDSWQVYQEIVYSYALSLGKDINGTISYRLDKEHRPESLTFWQSYIIKYLRYVDFLHLKVENTAVCKFLFTQPLHHGQDVTQGQFSSRLESVGIQFFVKSDSLIMAKEPSRL